MKERRLTKVHLKIACRFISGGGKHFKICHLSVKKNNIAEGCPAVLRLARPVIDVLNQGRIWETLDMACAWGYKG